MAQHIIIKEYDVNYPSMFEKEKELLVPILKENLVDIFILDLPQYQDLVLSL